MRVLIVDDEPAARRRLAGMLEELDIEVAGEAANGVQALEHVAALRPDVLLLDIHMREVSGLDVARHLPEPRPIVIFQTAHDAYAVEAFDHAALDYLLKPVSLERLRLALNRAQVRLQLEERPALDLAAVERLQAALERGSGAGASRLIVRDGPSHRLIAIRDIIRFIGSEGLVYAHTATERHAISYTLDELETRTGTGFARASRAELVNIEYVRRITSSGDGSAILTLSDGAKVRVSRRRAVNVRRRPGGVTLWSGPITGGQNDASNRVLFTIPEQFSARWQGSWDRRV